MKKTWSRVLATVLVLAMVLCMPGFAASVADTTDFESDRATSADELTDADLPELLSSDATTIRSCWCTACSVGAARKCSA